MPLLVNKFKLEIQTVNRDVNGEGWQEKVRVSNIRWNLCRKGWQEKTQKWETGVVKNLARKKAETQPNAGKWDWTSEIFDKGWWEKLCQQRHCWCHCYCFARQKGENVSSSYQLLEAVDSWVWKGQKWPQFMQNVEFSTCQCNWRRVVCQTPITLSPSFEDHPLHTQRIHDNTPTPTPLKLWNTTPEMKDWTCSFNTMANHRLCSCEVLLQDPPSGTQRTIKTKQNKNCSFMFCHCVSSFEDTQRGALICPSSLLLQGTYHSESWSEGYAVT